MFLAELDHEQKSSFWVVAQTMIASDGKLDEKEAIMMEQYGAEMNLSSSDIKAVDVDSAIQSLASSLPGLRKRIMFELVGLACADNDFTWCAAKIVASLLFVVALPELIGCILFAGGILILFPILLLGIAFGVVRSAS